MKRSFSNETLDANNPTDQNTEVLKKSRIDIPELSSHEPLTKINGNLNGDKVIGTNGNNEEIQNGHTNDNGQENGTTEVCSISEWFSQQESSLPEYTESTINTADTEAAINNAIETLEEDKEILTESASETELAIPVEQPAVEESCTVSREPSPNVEKVSPGPQQDLESGASCSKSKGWDQKKFETWSFSGHADLTTSLSLSGDTLVTASNDTTLKVWNLQERTEICSLGGHKGAVMCVQLLSEKASKQLLLALEENDSSGQVVISGAQDSFVKLWHIPTGKLLCSIYTFNNVWQVGFIEQENLVVTGTDGGKLELFNPVSKQCLSSEKAFDLPVVALKISGDSIVVGDTHAQLQIWKVKHQKLTCQKTTNAIESSRNTLTGLELTADGVFTGHITGSFKSLKWISGVVKRFGCVNKVTSLKISSSILVVVSSDQSSSALHFYQLPNVQYLGSIPCDSKLMSVDLSKTDDGWRVVAAGQKITVWQSSNLSSTDECECVTLWSQPENIETDSENEVDDGEVFFNKSTTKPTNSWCTIV